MLARVLKDFKNGVWPGSKFTCTSNISTVNETVYNICILKNPNSQILWECWLRINTSQTVCTCRPLLRGLVSRLTTHLQLGQLLVTGNLVEVPETSLKITSDS